MRSECHWRSHASASSGSLKASIARDGSIWNPRLSTNDWLSSTTTVKDGWK
jgi:hypothetical protein